MTDEQRIKITALRKQGCTLSAIADEVGLSANTVKTFCRRNKIEIEECRQAKEIKKCPCCGKEIIYIPLQKPKKFCSDKCRNSWWNKNIDQVNKKANYEIVCAGCKKTFVSYGNKGRKYCSHECYIADRFGGI